MVFSLEMAVAISPVAWRYLNISLIQVTLILIPNFYYVVLN